MYDLTELKKMERLWSICLQYLGKIARCHIYVHMSGMCNDVNWHYNLLM